MLLLPSFVLNIPLDNALESNPLACVLLPISRIVGKRRHHLEKQPGISRRGQDNVSFHS
jgi:hypothetical protein